MIQMLTRTRTSNSRFIQAPLEAVFRALTDLSARCVTLDPPNRIVEAITYVK